MDVKPCAEVCDIKPYNKFDKPCLEEEVEEDDQNDVIEEEETERAEQPAGAEIGHAPFHLNPQMTAMWPTEMMLWYSNSEIERHMSNLVPHPAYPSNPWFPQESIQYPVAPDGSYLYPHIHFNQHELYPPSDPFPSTPSTSSSLDYKCLPPPHPYYHNSLLPINNYAQQPDYSQVFQAWKLPAKTPRSQTKNSTVPQHRTGPGTNNVRVRTIEKYRMVYSDYQRQELEKEFLAENNISRDRRASLATQLQLTERQIKIWFQNRRAKDRREKSRNGI